MTYRHILISIDLTPDSLAVLAQAAAIARRFEARTSLIHVVEPVMIEPMYDGIGPLAGGWDDDAAELARTELGKLAALHGIDPAAQHVEIGGTREAILRVAAEVSADLIVIGSHGRSGIGLLLGSTANAVLHQAKCDVLAVRIGRR